MIVYRSFRIHASRFLPNLPDDHICKKMHGHTFNITVSIEDVIRLNISAMALSIFVGSDFEKETLVNLTKLVNKGEKFGIPVLAVTAVGKDMVRDSRYLGLACRIAAELGAHIVKTYYCDDFEKVVKISRNLLFVTLFP